MIMQNLQIEMSSRTQRRMHKEQAQKRRRGVIVAALAVMLLLGVVLVVALAAGGAAEEVPLIGEESKRAELEAERYFVARRTERYVTYWEMHPDLSAAEVVKRVNCDFDKVRYQDVVDADLSYGVLSLVSKYYYLGHYTPDDLVELGSKYGSGVCNSLARVAAEAFMRMADAAAAEGVTLKNVSGYRSYDVQKSLYSGYSARDGSAVADTYSSRAGYSEHQTGLATDINEVEESFEKTPAFAWLQAHAAEYGFIMRYPKGLDEITGFMYEPWHYRYVGVEAAQQIVKEGLTYEEYYAYYVEQ